MKHHWGWRSKDTLSTRVLFGEMVLDMPKTPINDRISLTEAALASGQTTTRELVNSRRMAGHSGGDSRFCWLRCRPDGTNTTAGAGRDTPLSAMFCANAPCKQHFRTAECCHHCGDIARWCTARARKACGGILTLRRNTFFKNVASDSKPLFSRMLHLTLRRAVAY